MPCKLAVLPVRLAHISCAVALALAVVPASAQDPVPITADDEAVAQRRRLDNSERQLLPEANRIADPSERSLALDRVAKILTTSENLLRAPGADPEENAILERFRRASRNLTAQDRGRLEIEREQALEDLRLRRAAESVPRYQQAFDALQGAFDAAQLIPDSTMRDVRCFSAAKTAAKMTKQILREVAPESGYREGDVKLAPLPIELRASVLRIARKTVSLAGLLAKAIQQDNFRSEALSLVAKSESSASSQIARFLKRGNQANDAVRSMLGPYPDQMLVESYKLASLVPIAIWRDRALVELVTDAATSEQYDRARQVAVRIPQSQARADALIRLAEAQALEGYSDEATKSYQDATVAVASIPMEAPRRTVANVLLDSLILVNRFEDARIASTLIGDPIFRREVLSAVALAMGERGLDEAAYTWIDREAPPEDRDALRRNVIDGMQEYVYNGRKKKAGERDLSTNELRRREQRDAPGSDLFPTPPGP